MKEWLKPENTESEVGIIDWFLWALILVMSTLGYYTMLEAFQSSIFAVA